MSTYGNTGNTTTTGITPAQQANFNHDLPRDYQGVQQQVVTGPSGTEQTPLSPVVIAPGGTDYSYNFDGGTNYLLAGSGAKINLQPSHGSGGQTVQVNPFLSGHDTITLNHGADYVQDTGGYNRITTRGGGDTVSSAGHNLINVHGNNNVIYGAAKDTINLGNSTHDTVDAGYGRETINGGQNSTISGYGHTSISGGVNNTINLTGSDTLSGSISNKFAAQNAGAPNATNDTVNVAANSSVFIDGKQSTGMTVNVEAGTTGHDTIFGGGHFGVTINATALGSYTETQDPNNAAIHQLHFSSGDTLSVNNVTIIDTKGTHQV